MIEIRVDGVRGKGRARFNSRTKRAYTPGETVKAEGEILGAWLQARGVRVIGPVVMSVEAVFSRPENHWRKSGDLSAAGLRSDWPTKRPDADNILKLAADALNGVAFTDDAMVVQARVVKRWANPGENEHTVITVQPMTFPLRAVA